MGVVRSIRENVLPLFSQVTRVTRHLVLIDSVRGVTVPGQGPAVHGTEWAPHFDLPGLVPGLPGILFFGATPHSEGATLTVRLGLGGDHLIRHTFQDGAPQSWHRTIPPNILRATDNELICSVTGALNPSMTFSDVVLMYTSEETTVKTPLVVVADS